MMSYNAYLISLSTLQVKHLLTLYYHWTLRLSTEEAGIKYDIIQRLLDKSLYTAGKALTYTLLSLDLKIEH